MSKMMPMFDPTREGKGVKKTVGEKKRFFLFWELVFRKFSKMCGLNILYVLCCIPIVTIGPATAGLMYVLRNMSQEKPVFVVHDFFNAFKKNFKPAFLAGVLELILFAVAIFSTTFYYSVATTPNSMAFLGLNPDDAKIFGWAAAIITLVALCFLLFMSYYLYLLIVTVDLPLRKIIKNSALLAIAGFKTNIITTFFVVLITFACTIGIMLTVVNIVTTILLAVYLISFIHFIVAFNSYQYIKKYVTDPFYAERGEKAPDDPAESEHIFEDLI